MNNALSLPHLNPRQFRTMLIVRTLITCNKMSRKNDDAFYMCLLRIRKAHTHTEQPLTGTDTIINKNRITLEKIAVRNYCYDQFQINPITHFHYTKMNELVLTFFWWVCVSTFHSSAGCTFVINFDRIERRRRKKEPICSPMKETFCDWTGTTRHMANINSMKSRKIATV